MKGKLHTIPQAHIFSDSKSETELANDLGIADVLDSRWGVGKFQGVFDESTKKPTSGQCIFKDARYFGESGMSAIVREYLENGKTWLGTVFYDEDGSWADGVFGEDWTLLEGDEPCSNVWRIELVIIRRQDGQIVRSHVQRLPSSILFRVFLCRDVAVDILGNGFQRVYACKQ